MILPKYLNVPSINTPILAEDSETIIGFKLSFALEHRGHKVVTTADWLMDEADHCRLDYSADLGPLVFKGIREKGLIEAANHEMDEWIAAGE